MKDFTAIMEATAAKVEAEFAKPFSLVCPKADIRRVLSTNNVRWREGDIGSLFDYHDGDSDRDVVVYAVVGDTAYAVEHKLFRAQRYSELSEFALYSPTVVDITHLFTQDNRPGETLVVDERLGDILVEKVNQARENIINSWVAALKKSPHEWNLSRLMREMAEKSNFLWYSTDALVEPICHRLDKSVSSFGPPLIDVMSQLTIRLPQWLGMGQVEANLYMQNAVGTRDWSKVKKDRYRRSSPSGSLRLDQGPLVVMTAGSEAARAYCERLIEEKTYGDVVLLIGDGPELQQEAQRLSDYLFGVDIIKH